MYVVCLCTGNMSCFRSNKTLCDCDGTVLLNVYIYLVFIGEGWLALVPLRLPHLRRLCLFTCYRVYHKYVEELKAAAPELEVVIPSGIMS
jgi:hypothetical protein